jgi:hypothetical protein
LCAGDEWARRPTVLQRVLRDLVAADRLPAAAAAICTAATTQPELLPSRTHLLSCALACTRASTRTDQWDVLASMLASLPSPPPDASPSAEEVLTLPKKPGAKRSRPVLEEARTTPRKG